ATRDRDRRLELCRGAACRSPPGPGRDPPGRDARPRDDRDRADRRRDGPSRPRDPPYAERTEHDRSRDRRLPADATGAGPDAAREHASGRRDAGAASDADSRRPRRLPRDPAAGRRRSEPHPAGEGRAGLLRDADERAAGHADHGAGPRRAREETARLDRGCALRFQPQGRARRSARAQRYRGERHRRRARAPVRPASRRELVMSGYGYLPEAGSFPEPEPPPDDMSQGEGEALGPAFETERAAATPGPEAATSAPEVVAIEPEPGAAPTAPLGDPGPEPQAGISAPERRRRLAFRRERKPNPAKADAKDKRPKKL